MIAASKLPDKTTVPAETVKSPVKMLSADNVNVEVPDLVTRPAVLVVPITPDNVWSTDEPYVKVAAFAIAIVPAYVPEPKLPVPPIANVPAETVVLPVYVLVPVKVNVPAPALVKVAAEAPSSEITPVIEPVPEFVIEIAPPTLIAAAVNAAEVVVKPFNPVVPPTAPVNSISPVVVTNVSS